MNINVLQKYILETGYAKWLADQARPENFDEIIDRVLQMHLRRFPVLKQELTWAFEQVREGLILPAMRSLQYGGEEIEQNHARIYNTWASHVDRIEVFSQALFLLLSGGGIGFSVQRQHVNQLPIVQPPKKTTRFLVENSIEGWMRAVDAVIRGRFAGVVVELDTTRLPSGPGRYLADGSYVLGVDPLLNLVGRIETTFAQAENRQLKPIECYDLMCFIADASSEGVGRSAMLTLFSLDDEEMVSAKTGDWYSSHPWRARSNNSAVLIRGPAERRRFDDLFDHCREWGDPGVFWVNDPDVCSNSCVEVGFYPVLTVKPEHLQVLPQAKVGQRLSGWQGCTLSEINGARLESIKDFKIAARAAAIINTVQASYLDIEKTLGTVSRLLCERDALIGVGITGMADSPDICFNPNFQRAAAEVVLETNQEIAQKIAINPAKRTTLVKPAGKTSLVFGGVAPGLHPHHEEKYFLRLTPKKSHPAHEEFKNKHEKHFINHENGERIVFAILAPRHSVRRTDLTALEFLKIIHSTIQNWVIPGTRDVSLQLGITHNASNTVSVRENEWEEVRDFIWNHQENISGVALMSYYGDGKHPLAPLQALFDLEDHTLWSKLAWPATKSTNFSIENLLSLKTPTLYRLSNVNKKYSRKHRRTKFNKFDNFTINF